MATSTAASSSTWRWRPTVALVNSVRFISALLTIIILIILGSLAFSAYEKHQKAYPAIDASLAELKSLAQKAQKELSSINQNIGEAKEAVYKSHAEQMQATANSVSTIASDIETQGVVIRNELKPIRTTVDLSQQKMADIASQLSASREEMAEQQKAALERLTAAKAGMVLPHPEPEAKAPEPIRSESSVTASFVTKVRSAPKDEPARHSAVFPQGGASRVFSRKEVEDLDIKLAPVPGIHAVLIYKNGLFKTWTRPVDIPAGEQFDIKGAAQVVFWSDDPFWLTWKKY